MAGEEQSRYVMNPYEKRQDDLKNKLRPYYLTENWHTVSAIVIARDVTCQMCHAASAVQAHHLTYKSVNSLGITFPVECVGVCLECHESIHRKKLDYGR